MFVHIIIIFPSTFSLTLHWAVLVGSFFGNLLVSLGIALILTLVVESPFVKLEKLIVGRLLGAGGKSTGKKPV